MYINKMNSNIISALSCIFYLHLTIAFAGNVVTFGNENGMYRPILNNAANQEIYIRASNTEILSIQVGNIIYGNTGTGFPCCIILLPSNGYFLLSTMQSSSSTRESTSSMGPLDYIAIMPDVWEPYSCGSINPSSTVQWNMTSTGGYNVTLAGIYFDDDYVYGLQFNIVQDMAFKLGGSNSGEVPYTGNANMIQPGDILSFYWSQTNVYHLAGMSIMRNATALNYGNTNPGQITSEFQIYNASRNFELHRIESTNLYDGTQAITYMEGQIDSVPFTMGKSIDQNAALSTSYMPATLTGLYTSPDKGTGATLIDALEFSAYSAANASSQYSLQCAADLAFFNTNLALIQAQTNWIQMNQQCINDAAKLPVSWNTYVVNCNEGIENLQAACFNMSGNFCTYVGLAYTTADYGMTLYKFNLWNRGCIPSSCMNSEFDRQQIGWDIMNATRNIFPQCSKGICSYMYEYTVQCENGFPVPPQKGPSLSPWAISAIVLGSIFIVLVIIGSIVAVRRRYHSYIAIK
jgi:hypothetical protein